jgi:hypothetical protein
MKLSVRFSLGDYLIALGGVGQEGVASVTSNSHRHRVYVQITDPLFISTFFYR